ncbi:uncharacterized protein EV420DRAFT_694432 [Desarmillaria tabescens]|uniref:C2H2-type domain-containing protein n=1 Tax=Armillaria tabescens TaxID=1929756 RepID=A0AA39K0J6_ARMTA|nr:uncharacterized protein EV420DRAFT_694432 [Desarmillaria tabescens]KAK0452153.1 hypothetical protein EV420DRAFT_694432 [Desarmillaria tabescens]
MCSKSCPKCGKKMLNLNRHLITHFSYSDRPFRCKMPDCGFAATQSGGLKIHMNTMHTGEKPYRCPEPTCKFATGDTSKLCNHRKKEHRYVPGKENKPKKRVTKVEEMSDENTFREAPFVATGHEVNSTRSPGRDLVNKGQEELPIAALPFPFPDFVSPIVRPVMYEQAEGRALHPMTVDYQFPASWSRPTQAPIMPAYDDRSIEGPGYYVPCHNYGPLAAYPCDAVYSSSQFPQSVVPRVFAGGNCGTANQGLGGWSAPQAAAGYLDHGYADSGAGVSCDTQRSQVPPLTYGVDTSFESPFHKMLAAMNTLNMISY